MIDAVVCNKCKRIMDVATTGSAGGSHTGNIVFTYDYVCGECKQVITIKLRNGGGGGGS